jgi:hypothetical protein
MMTDELDLKRQAVNEVAAKQLQMLFGDLEEAHKDNDLLPQYEIDFLGDLYARLIVSAYMGYRPNRLANDAEDAALKLFERAKEHDQNQGNT